MLQRSSRPWSIRPLKSQLPQRDIFQRRAQICFSRLILILLLKIYSVPEHAWNNLCDWDTGALSILESASRTKDAQKCTRITAIRTKAAAIIFTITHQLALLAFPVRIRGNIEEAVEEDKMLLVSPRNCRSDLFVYAAMAINYICRPSSSEAATIFVLS